MVLQQNCEAVIWGCATPGSTVTVTPSWSGSSIQTRTDASGSWTVKAKTPEASYHHHSIEVKGDGMSLTISDVLVGEVWFASGQSNMDITMHGYYNCPIEDANRYIANPPGTDRVRMYTEPVAASYEAVVRGSGYWKRGNSEGVWDMSAVAFFFAEQLNRTLDVPVGIICCAYGGSRVESWIPESQLREWGSEDLSRERIEAMTDYHRPFKAYNAMFNPIAGYTVKGFIWYQGCSNVGAHEEYVEHMKWLIGHWRSRFGDEAAELPFYLVEIAPYTYSDDSGTSEGALLRNEQHKLCKEVENCAIVVTNDLVDEYEKDNIHPARKREIGERLAWLAMNRQYGFSRVACGSPEALGAFIPEDREYAIAVNLSNFDNGIDRMHGIEGLEVRSADGPWVKATDISTHWPDNYIMIHTPDVRKPVAVRYGWGDFKPGNLHNAEGLPVSPFIIELDRSPQQ